MLILPGSNALSAFRSQRLLSQLQAVAPSIAAVQARFYHFIDASAPLTTEDTERLSAMLTYGEPAAQTLYEGVTEEFFVIPRLGTISPWASKATDIGRQHPGARVVVTEPVPEYLLDAAGVQNVTPQEFSSTVEEGTDPPAAVVAQTLGLFGAQPPVDALVLNGQTQSAATDQVRDAAEQAGVPVVEMSETLPDGVTDYMQWMNTNLDALDGALTR